MSSLPKNGKIKAKRKGVLLARISTAHQDERSLDDQIAYCRKWAEAKYGPGIEWIVITSRGSGEFLDRKELIELENLVESEAIQFVVVEDLARICRRNRAFDFCEMCEDHDVRFVAINDAIDTAEDNWRHNACFATMKHQFYNADTAKRIRRSLRNRFQQGGVVMTVPYGYLKPEGAKSDSDLVKDPEAESILKRWFEMLDNGASYSEIADWLNELGAPTGKWCRSGRWTCAMVSRVTHSLLLKGIRIRNRVKSKRINKTGRRKAVTAPAEERLVRECPHLAFFDADYYDRVVREADRRNARYRRGKNGTDPRKNVPRKRTAYPGQSCRCDICGSFMVWGGHGVMEHLMCSGSKDYRCWNAVTFDGSLCRKRMAEVIMEELERLPDFDQTLFEEVRRKLDVDQSQRMERLSQLDKERKALEFKIERIIDAIADGRGSESLSERLAQYEQQKLDLEDEANQLQRAPVPVLQMPTPEELSIAARQAFEELEETSPEFWRLMNQLVKDFRVYPVRCCDGGHVVLRGTFTLHLAHFLRPEDGGDILDTVLSKELSIDLFEPPQRIFYRKQVAELKLLKVDKYAIASSLGITHTAVQNAWKLHRMMQELGISDPYFRLSEPPADYNRLRRHRHPRYRFQPYDGGA